MPRQITWPLICYLPKSRDNAVARDVFISYKEEDRSATTDLCAQLERENISCWMTPRDIPPGKDWPTAIVERLQRCRFFVLILSANSPEARQIAREVKLADARAPHGHLPD